MERPDRFEMMLQGMAESTDNGKGVFENPVKRKRLLEKKREIYEKFRIKLESNWDNMSPQLQKEYKEYVLKRKSEFKEKKVLDEFAEIVEGIIVDQVNSNNWFGKNFRMKFASEFDDYRNGIDAIGVYSDPDSKSNTHIGFAIDISISSNNTILEKKFNFIKDTIEKGDMPEVKYFLNEKGEHESLSVSKVVLALDTKSAEMLADLWDPNNSAKEWQLKDHYVQAKLISEIILQLEYFVKFAAKCGNNLAYVEYSKMLSIFTKVREENNNIKNRSTDEYAKDFAYKHIETLTKKEEGQN